MTGRRTGRPSVLGRYPLRVRLVAIFGLLLIAAVSTISVLSVIILRHNLVTQAENSVYLSNDYALNTLSERVGVAADFASLKADFGLVPSPDGFYLIAKGSKPVFSAYLSRDFELRDLTAAESTEILASTTSSNADDDDAAATTINLSTLGEYVTLATPVTLTDEPETGYTFVTSVGLNESGSTIGGFVLAEVVIGAVAAAITGLIGYRVVRTALAPLERVVDVADRVAGTPMSSGEVARQERVTVSDSNGRSEAVRVSEALNRLLSHLETSLNARHLTEESMRRFVAEASHELRNPLASIRGYADFYADTPELDAEVRSALQRIGAESKRMNALVENLLLLAKLDADPALRRDDVDVSRLILETVSDTRVAHPSHVWRLTLSSQPTVAVGDEDAIRQVLLNLLANAGHHTPPGTVVTVSVLAASGSAVIRVHDNGPGIAAEAIPTLFDRFTQAARPASGNTRDATTVGLGLAIVQAIVSASGYTITLASSPGSTTFEVHVPGHLLRAAQIEQ